MGYHCTERENLPVDQTCESCGQVIPAAKTWVPMFAEQRTSGDVYWAFCCVECRDRKMDSEEQ